MNRLISTLRSMERSISGMKKKVKIRPSSIRAKIKCKGIVRFIKKLKIADAGHIARLPVNRWCRNVTFWVPCGHSTRIGRPALRWRDEIIRRVGVPWCRVPQNHQIWSKVGEAYARNAGAWYES